MAMFDWLFGKSSGSNVKQIYNSCQAAYEQEGKSKFYEALMMQNIHGTEEYYRMIAQQQHLQKNIFAKTKPVYVWDGKPWYPLDIANRRKTWDGKIWYPLSGKVRGSK